MLADALTLTLQIESATECAAKIAETQFTTTVFQKDQPMLP